MKTRTYQISLATAVVVSVLLAVALAFALFHRGNNAPAATSSQDFQDPIVARGPDAALKPMPRTDDGAAGTEPALATVQLSPQRLQEIGVTTATVQRKDVNDTLNVPGNVNMDEERLSYVQTRFPGWIQNVFANATYQYVRKGERLFTIYSPDLVSSEQEYLLARKNQNTFAPNAQDDMAAQESGWLMRAAQERLRQFGVPPQAIADLEQSGKVQRDIAIVAPASGYIIDRMALPNAYVQPDTKLYTIADLSTVWVYANVFQDDVGRLKPGDTAQVTVDAYPGRQFNGRIDQILPEVDPTTRTVRVRLVLRNPGVALKPGMYVNVAISVPLGQQLVIPASAVLQSGSQAIAFLDHGNGVLEPRVVELGQQLNDSVIVLGGLKAGDRVVSSANFLVDSEAQLQAAMGAFSPLPQPVAGANKAGEAQMQIDLSTQPSTPRKGANMVRVKLTGSDGKPVTGAQVSVTFILPAMPAMGMAAQHTTAALADKGNGIYEGSALFPSGGTWATTVTVQRGSKTIASKQLSLDAAGGM
jgi:Cu(I)/Ag(I) efflux system membrane fusion protein/cobalt-zinc-cadmium efflux system membrane fusion protein